MPLTHFGQGAAQPPTGWTGLLLPVVGLSLFVGLGPAALAQEFGEGFVERALELGLDHRSLSGFDELTESWRSVADWAQCGVAFGDVDGDGDQDLVGCGSMLPTHLYLNPGAPDVVWTETAAQAGICSAQLDRAPAFGDYDRDGDVDLFIGSMIGGGIGAEAGRGRLYENDGTGQFEDITALSGTVGRGRTLFANWFDLDNDGWLDLYLSEFHTTPNAWYRNNTNGSFTELAEVNGLADTGSAHATGVADLDGDSQWDVIVGNDFFVGDLVQVTGPNKGDAFLKGAADGLYTDLTAASGTGQEEGIMGIAFGDYDQDGDFDIYKTDIGTNWLLENSGWPGSTSAYVNVAGPLGVLDEKVPFLDQPGQKGLTSGWAAMFIDIDLDSVLDLFVVNGHVAGINPVKTFLPRQQRNSMYRGLGPAGNYAFQDVGGPIGLADFYDDRAGAFADVDADGDLDLVVVETAGRLRYFENRMARGEYGFLTAKVVGQTSGSEGEGTLLRWTGAAGDEHSVLIGNEGPTASQHERIAHFGLGTLDAVDLRVRYASGVEQTLLGVPANTRLELVEPKLFEIGQQALLSSTLGIPGAPTKFILTAFAHAADGSALGAGASVTLEIPGLTPGGPVQDMGDGSYRRRFLADGTPGPYRVEADFAGFVPAVRPVVHMIGPVDPAVSRVQLSQQSMRAGSTDRTDLVVTPCDTNGIAMGAGRTVTVDVLQAGMLPVVDLGDGRYRATIPAPALPTTEFLSVRVDGVALPQVELNAAGPADANETGTFPALTYAHHAAAPDVTRLLVKPRDSSGRALGSDAVVELRLLLPPPPPVGSAQGCTGRGSALPGAVGGPLTSGQGAHPGSGGPAKGTPEPSFQGWAEVVPTETYGRPDGTHLFAIRYLPALAEITTAIGVEIWVDGALLQTIQQPLEL